MNFLIIYLFFLFFFASLTSQFDIKVKCVNSAQHPHSNESNELVVVIVSQPRNAGQVVATT